MIYFFALSRRLSPEDARARMASGSDELDEPVAPAPGARPLRERVGARA